MVTDEINQERSRKYRGCPRKVRTLASHHYSDFAAQFKEAVGQPDEADLSDEPRLAPASMRRDAAMARRVRGFFAVVMALMMSPEAADSIPGASLPPMPLGVVLAGLLLFVNFVDPTRDPRVTEKVAQQRRIVECVLDALIVFSAIWLVGLNPASSLWVLLLFPITQAVIRFGERNGRLFRCYFSHIPGRRNLGSEPLRGYFF